MMFHLQLLFVLVIVPNSYGGLCEDYLKEGVRHVTCETHSLKKECAGGKMENLTQYQHFIMDRHNYYRDLRASGHVEGYDSAVRMTAVWKWHPQMSNFSERGVKQCDDKLRTRVYEVEGTERCVNIYRVDNAYTSYSVEEIIRDAIMSWFDEYERCPKSEISNFTGQYTNSCRNFHNMICDRMNAMACAMLTKIVDDKRLTMFFCVYGGRTFPMMTPIIPEKRRPSNYITAGYIERVYKEGPMASQCQTRHPKYLGLCMGEEFSDLDRSWSTAKPKNYGPRNYSVNKVEEGGAPHCQAFFGAVWLLLTAFILSRL